jgi:hypothetical protein
MSDLFSDLMNGFVSGNKPAQGGAMDLVGGLLGASGALGGSQKSAGGMMDLIGAVAGGGNSGAAGLLGGLLGGGQQQSPMASLLAPVTNGLAKKLGIPPALASIATGFLMNKMFGGSQQSAGSGGGGFGLDSLLGVMNGGGAGAADFVAKSGLVGELAQTAKVDEKQAGNVLSGLIGMLSGDGAVSKDDIAKAAAKQMGIGDIGGLMGLLK